MARHIKNCKLRRGEWGFTYLTVLFMAALLGVMMAAAGILWSTAQQREKERDLLFIGNAYRKAIALYYVRTPGAVKRFPQSLRDLLRDERQLSTVRYLRQPYADPMMPGSGWGIVRAPDGGIAGVFSQSLVQPLKRGNFAGRDGEFENAETYSRWQFVYRPVDALRQEPKDQAAH